MDWFGYTFLALHLCLSGRSESGGQVIVDSTLEAALDQKLQAMRDQDRSVDFSALMADGLRCFFVFFRFWKVSIEMIFDFQGKTLKIQEFSRNSSSKRGGYLKHYKKLRFFSVKRDGLTVWPDAVDPALQEYQTSMATVKVDEVDEAMDRLGMWVAHPLPTDITYPPCASVWHLNPPFGDTSKGLETWNIPVFSLLGIGSLDMEVNTSPTTCGCRNKSWPGIYQTPVKNGSPTNSQAHLVEFSHQHYGLHLTMHSDQVFRRADGNGDGHITKEFYQRMVKKFDRFLDFLENLRLSCLALSCKRVKTPSCWDEFEENSHNFRGFRLGNAYQILYQRLLQMYGFLCDICLDS